MVICQVQVNTVPEVLWLVFKFLLFLSMQIKGMIIPVYLGGDIFCDGCGISVWGSVTGSASAREARGLLFLSLLGGNGSFCLIR